MKNCTDCKYARWNKTVAGKLHPSGDGHCTYDYKIPLLPASMYWLSNTPPTPNGGYINRCKELLNHCPYYMINTQR